MQRILAPLLLLSACGDDSGTPPVDAAQSDSQPVDARVDAGPTTREGQVFIAETSSIAIAVAMFLDAPLFPELGTAGQCIAGGNQPASSIDAGTVTITGTTNPITLAQEDPTDVYTPPGILPADIYTPGATLTVTATGGAVAAFTGTVVAPDKLTGVMLPAAYSRSAPPTITWTAGSGEEMWFLLASANTASGAILCRVPDTGSYTMTAAELALLPAAVTQVTTLYYRMNESIVAAGAHEVFLRAADGDAGAQVAVTP